ncbi:hypothetical protein CLAFUR0_14517, partial [Fulvia fulva]
MTSPTDQDLRAIVQHYGEVAELTNRRRMERFIEEIRQRWRPYSHEEDYRQEDWTDEGAFTKCIFQEAFYGHDQPKMDRSRSDLSWAEVEGQIQSNPSLGEIMDFVRRPLTGPQPESVRIEILGDLKEAMKRQLETSGIADTSKLELPSDLEVLFSVVDRIRQAGVPLETAYTQLVYSLGTHRGATDMPYYVSLSRRRHDELYCPIAAFELGGGGQHRSTYYVLGQPSDCTELTSSATWQIWDLFGNHELDYY